MDFAFALVSDLAMAHKPKSEKLDKIGTHPDAWKRFEHAVDAAVKSGPKHRKSVSIEALFPLLYEQSPSELIYEF